jgi:hypothetical protein
MKSQLQLNHVENFLQWLQDSGNYPELEGMKIHKADGRLGKLIALARIGEHGTVFTKTDFVTATELNQFLRGYMFKQENRLKIQS